MKTRQLLVSALPGLAAMMLFAVPVQNVLAASSNGHACNANSDCKSGQCAPGPSLRPDQPGPRYCLHRRRSCALAGKPGGNLGNTINFQGQKLVCANPSQYGWGSRPAQYMLPKGPTTTSAPTPPSTPAPGSPSPGIVGPGFQNWELNPPAKTRFPLTRTITAKFVTGIASGKPVHFLWNCQASTMKTQDVVPVQQAQKVFGYTAYAAASTFTPRDGATEAERRCTSNGAFITLQATDTSTGKQIGNFIWYLAY